MFHGGGGAVIGAFTTLGLLMAIVAVITGRHLADERAMRPRAIYLSVAMLPVLVIGVVAASAFIEAAVQLMLGPEQDGGFLAASAAACQERRWVAWAILSPASAAFRARPDRRRDPHARGRRAGSAWRSRSTACTWTGAANSRATGSPWRRRAFQSFAYTVVLVFIVIFVASAIEAGYGVFRVAAPGTSAMFSINAERERGIADIVSGLAMAGASWWLVQTHWKLAGTWRGDTDDAPSVPEPPAV